MNKNNLCLQYPATFILIISIICGGCVNTVNKLGENTTIEMKKYTTVTLEELQKHPAKYNNQPIAVLGVYSGYKNIGPVLFRNNEDFEAMNFKQGILIVSLVSQHAEYINVKHGAPAVVQGVFRSGRENEINLFFAKIVDVVSVTGQAEEKGKPK